jgi:hypothetical protein
MHIAGLIFNATKHAYMINATTLTQFLRDIQVQAPSQQTHKQLNNCTLCNLPKSIVFAC